MSADHHQRKITNEDAVHIGLATKDPGAYLFASLVIELIKLPFSLIGLMFRSAKSAKEKQQRKSALAATQAQAEKKYQAELAPRMAERKRAYLARIEEEKRQALVESMKPKPVKPVVDSKISDETRRLWREEAAPGLVFDDYLYAWELFKTTEGHDFVTTRGLSHESLEKRLRELHEQNKQFRGNSTMRLTPTVKEALRSGGKAARERFQRENPGQSGIVEVTIPDLLEGAVSTEHFVKELDPIWEYLRKNQKS